MAPAKTGSRPHGIARRLIIAVVLFSSLITLIVTAYQLYRDYDHDLVLIDNRLRQIQEVHLRSIASSLWVADEREMQTLVEGIHNLPDMQYLEIRERGKVWVSVGINKSENVIVRQYPLIYTHLGQELEIGMLTAVATLEGIYGRLIDKAVVILVSNGIKTFLVSGFILLVFHFLVTRHLVSIARFLRDHDISRAVPPLRLDRKNHGRSKADEIDLVVDELNLMRQGLRESFNSLKESEAHARNLLNSTAESIYGIDLEGECTFCNPSGVKMLGYDNEEDLLGRNMHDLIHHTYPDGSPYPAKEYLIYKAFLYGERAHSDTEVLWRKDGSCFPAEYWSYPIWSGGELAGSVVTFLDITKRKENENELRKAHDELEQRVAKRTSALTEEIHDRRIIELELLDRTELQQMIFAITAIANKAKDTDAALAACLKEICDYTTWPVGHIYAASPSDPDKFVPTDIWHMEHPEWFSVFHDITMKTVYEKGVGMVGRVMASGKPEWIEDVTKSPDFVRAIPGVNIVARAGFGFPIKVGNKVVAVMEFFSPFDQKADQSLLQSIEQIGTQLGRLHERAEAEVTLLDEKEKAETANKAKSDFLSSMSHELRTPLNAIIGFSSTMKEETFGPIGNDKYREYLDDIHHSGQHLLKLINDILDVSAIEAGALELHEENVCLANVVNSSINLVRPRADDGGVSVTASIDPQIPLIYVDERRLKQIMLNLLSNAVKFTPRGGEVSVSARINDDCSLAVAVADTGVGMDEEEIKTALRRFGQVDSGLDRKHEGAGLGLPLTKRLMEQHGGTLEVKSKKGHGAMITVTFPKDRVIHIGV